MRLEREPCSKQGEVIVQCMRRIRGKGTGKQEGHGCVLEITKEGNRGAEMELEEDLGADRERWSVTEENESESKEAENRKAMAKYNMIRDGSGLMRLDWKRTVEQAGRQRADVTYKARKQGSEARSEQKEGGNYQAV